MNKDNRSSLGAYTVISLSSTQAENVGSLIIDTANYNALFFVMTMQSISAGHSVSFVRLDQADEFQLNNAGTGYELKDPEEVPEDQLFAQNGLKGANAVAAFQVASGETDKAPTLGVFGNKRYLRLYIQGSSGITWTGSVNIFADELIVPVIASDAE